MIAFGISTLYGRSAIHISDVSIVVNAVKETYNFMDVPDLPP